MVPQLAQRPRHSLQERDRSRSVQINVDMPYCALQTCCSACVVFDGWGLTTKTPAGDQDKGFVELGGALLALAGIPDVGSPTVKH